MDRRDVRRVYEDIAPHFSETRHHAWPEVTTFLDERTGGRGLDVGCGNGRHLEVLGESVETAVGVDASRELLSIARDRVGSVAAVLAGDAARLPIADGTMDLGLYVATIHHLPDQDLRVSSLNELARVLTPGGEALVSSWSTEADRFDQEEAFDTTLEWTLPSGETVDRYFHIYNPVSFQRDLECSALTVEDHFISTGNCYARVSCRG